MSGSKPFSPINISGLIAWWDADQITGLADGEAVTTWTDASGAGANITQATANRKPLYKTGVINGLPTVRFDGLNDGTGDYLRGAFNRAIPNTVFIVLQFLAAQTGATKTIMDGVADPNNYMFQKLSTGAETERASCGTALNGPDTADFVTWHIWALTFNGASSSIHRDGTSRAAGNAGTGSQNGITIGGGAYLADTAFSNMDIAEVLIYNSVLSAVNFSKVGKYLAAKYALSFS